MSKLYTVKECAPILRISVSTLRRLLRQKVIGYSLVGKKIIISDSDVSEFMEKFHFCSLSNEKGEENENT